MKKLTLTLLLFINIINYSQEKFEGEIIYKVTLNRPDFSKLEKNKKISKKRKEEIKKTFKFSENVEATMQFNGKESLYSVKKSMRNESNKRINFTEIFAGNTDKFYVNSANKEYFYQTSTFGENLLIEMAEKKWRLTQETKKIGKYTCYKAIDLDSKNYSTIAWYTPEIPVNFGPKKYFGLPGLILELQDSATFFSVIKIKISNKRIKIKKPTKGKKLTAKEYAKIRNRNSPFKNKRKN